MLNHLVLSLILTDKIDIDAFFDTLTTQLQGRYGGDSYFKDLAKPTWHYRANAAKGYLSYDISADELEPAFISVLDDFRKFSDFTFSFQVNGKNIDEQDFWRISSAEMLAAGHDTGFEDTDKYGKVRYDAQAAEYADDIYQTKIAAFHSSDSKTA